MTASASIPVIPPWTESSTSVAAVADELARRWNTASAGLEGTVVEKGMVAARASVLNLIVFVADAGAADRAVSSLLALGIRHPSRAIVLIARADHETDAGIHAEIRTHCLTGAADLPTCYDEVILTVTGETAHHLDGVVAPLVIHDLPTHIWWPEDPPIGDPIFDQLMDIGDRVIVDSADFSDLLAGLRRLGGLRRQAGIGDLCWERLGPMFEVTAEFFDATRFRRYLPNLNRMSVGYAVGDDGPAAPEASALLYAGWLATRLGWRRAHRAAEEPDGLHLRLESAYELVDLHIEPMAGTDHRPGEIVGLRLRAHGEAGSAEFLVDRSGDIAAIVSNVDGMTARVRHVGLADEDEPDILRRQLGADRRDMVYEDAVRAAAILLGAARGGGS